MISSISEMMLLLSIPSILSSSSKVCSFTLTPFSFTNLLNGLPSNGKYSWVCYQSSKSTYLIFSNWLKWWPNSPISLIGTKWVLLVLLLYSATFTNSNKLMLSLLSSLILYRSLWILTSNDSILSKISFYSLFFFSLGYIK